MKQAALDIGFAHDRTTGKEDWLTPPWLLSHLGAFDLDPCAPDPRPWDTAAEHYTMRDDGLTQTWRGRVWMNPPYGRKTPKWMRRLAIHGNGIALIYSRTETESFFPWVWDHATALFWLKDRLHFFTKDGTEGGRAGCGSVLIAYGEGNADCLRGLKIEGHYTRNR